MRPSYHIAASAGVSVGVHLTMHSWPAAMGCFVSGVLIDLDHYLEYYIFRKKFPWDYKDLVRFCFDVRVKQSFLVLHAYELLFLFWFFIYFFGLGKVWTGIAIGLTAHLALDQFTNPIKPLCYFLIYRMNHQFLKAKIFSEQYYHHSKKFEEFP